VFSRSGSAWNQQGAKLTGGGETGTGDFGSSVALSNDGNTALVGGPGDDANKGAPSAAGTTYSAGRQADRRERKRGSLGACFGRPHRLIGGIGETEAAWAFSPVRPTGPS
jgi:hypothetical protein